MRAKKLIGPLITRIGKGFNVNEDALERRILMHLLQSRKNVLSGVVLDQEIMRNIGQIRKNDIRMALDQLIKQGLVAKQRIDGNDYLMITSIGIEKATSIEAESTTTLHQAKMRVKQLTKKVKPNKKKRTNQNVYIVYGRNDQARKAMYTFLRSIKIIPLEWSEIFTNMPPGTPYTGDILDKGMQKAQAIVVLMTPDDKAYLKKRFRRRNEPIYETKPTGQARPNVIFEAGMAFSKFPDRTILVELGDIRHLSDLWGRYAIRLGNTQTIMVRKLRELAGRLEKVGCHVDLTGTDWLDTGDFIAALKD